MSISSQPSRVKFFITENTFRSSSLCNLVHYLYFHLPFIIYQEYLKELTRKVLIYMLKKEDSTFSTSEGSVLFDVCVSLYPRIHEDGVPRRSRMAYLFAAGARFI